MARQIHSLLSSCLHFIIVTIVVEYMPTLVHSSTLESDIQVLRSLKQSIDPISISIDSYLYSWDLSMDPCESTSGFLGILCTFPSDNSSNRIIEIDLDGAGYDGFLTRSIGNLTELATLNLGKNRFRGPIPETIVDLKKLLRLTLSENLLTGNIPSAVTRLRHLQIMDLSQNYLSGSIPANISGLRGLTHLRLSNNILTGKIPDLTGLWQLNTLDLGTNQLHGNLPKLPMNLRVLSLRHNELSGHISPIRILQQLKSLDVSDNRLSGHISEELLTLPQVVHLNVSVNHLNAIEPIKFPIRETQLQVLDAHANRLHGHLPATLVDLENLTSIDLSQNQFFGPIPMGYGAKLGHSWKRLFLNDNFLIGNLPPHFSNNTEAFKGSLANNCLRCPPNIPLCSGGQRPARECIRQNYGSR